MKRISFLLTVLAVTGTTVVAQSTEDSVKAAVNLLFTAMKNADAALLKTAFSDSAVLQTITRNKEGNTVVRTDKVSDFADFLGKQQKGDADERIQFETVKIDGPLAIAWTPYTFYYKGKLSHCGVNSFQLVRLNGTWKIQYIIDTRRREGCE
jgi:hypothetical protein